MQGLREMKMYGQWIPELGEFDSSLETNYKRNEKDKKWWLECELLEIEIMVEFWQQQGLEYDHKSEWLI